MVAGKNFGCGSSREHAPIAIKESGVSCVIANSFARIFYRNSINIGLPILECPEAVDAISEGDVVSVDADTGGIADELRPKGISVTAVCPGPTTVPAVCISAANSSIHTALSLPMPRFCLRRVFLRICLLTSSTRLAVSYISGKPPFRYCLSVKSPFTYIGTKIRENSHPKCKNLQKN